MRSHFLLHCSDNTIARTFTVKSLQTARYNIESRLIRVTDGEREVDKAGCELMLKVRAHARLYLAAVCKTCHTPRYLHSSSRRSLRSASFSAAAAAAAAGPRSSRAARPSAMPSEYQQGVCR